MHNKIPITYHRLLYHLLINLQRNVNGRQHYFMLASTWNAHALEQQVGNPVDTSLLPDNVPQSDPNRTEQHN